MPKVFSYVTTEEAPLYRAVLRAFVESKERFRVQLRPEDVLKALEECGVHELTGQVQLNRALARLCEWGNLQTNTEDPGNPFFQITSEGEAAERAIAQFETGSGHEPELPCTALADTGHVLQELRQLSREPETNTRKIHRNLVTLRACFEDLTATAQMLLVKLEQRIDAHAADDARRFVAYAEGFIAELVLATDSIGEAVRDIERSGIEQFHQPDWKRFRKWFVSEPGCPSNAEMLRERVRASVPVLLRAINNVNDQQLKRIGKANDFRVLARWFAETASDAEAHRLWRTVFGLCPARHLIINDQTLDDYEARDVPPGTSWLDAPPLRISTRRASATNAEMVTLSRIIDRSIEKQKLAAATHEEALRLLNARGRFGSGHRMRLSQLERLDTGEFDLLLDLLVEAVSARLFPAEAVEIISGDGSLRIKLEPTDDERQATIMTPEGALSGPDYWISIEQISFEEQQEVEVQV